METGTIAKLNVFRVSRHMRGYAYIFVCCGAVPKQKRQTSFRERGLNRERLHAARIFVIIL